MLDSMLENKIICQKFLAQERTYYGRQNIGTYQQFIFMLVSLGEHIYSHDTKSYLMNMTNKEFERLTFWYISEVTKSR